MNMSFGKYGETNNKKQELEKENGEDIKVDDWGKNRNEKGPWIGGKRV